MPFPEPTAAKLSVDDIFGFSDAELVQYMRPAFDISQASQICPLGLAYLKLSRLAACQKRGLLAGLQALLR
jgi:hypothetical protein